MSAKEKVIGIDLASSQSVVAIINEMGKAEVIVNEDGSRLTPSVILFDGDEIKIGASAKRKAVTMPKNTVTLIKRFMGGAYDSENIQKAVKNATFEVVNQNNKPYVKIDGKLYSAEELSSKIIGKLKKVAEDYYGTEVKKAVITCPALYDNVQREAVKLAGELAGLQVLRVINEPTAAVLAMPDLDMTQDKKILVVDLGGSTLDFSLCEISSEVVEVKSSYGNTYHGGADYDKRIVDHLLEQFKKENPDLELDAPSMSRFVEAAEAAKCALSTNTQTDINLPYLGNGKSFANFEYTLTRATYDRLVEDLIQELIRCGRECIRKVGVDKSEIDEILLVGGMTRCVNVQEALKNEFGCPLNKSVNPDEAVALGAAKQANILVGGTDGNDILLLDVTPISLGIRTMDDTMTVMIPANTTIPTKKTEVFTTAVDNQSAVTICVYQGERAFTSGNKLIGEFNLDGIMPAPRGVPQIEVTFDMDANGILKVTSKDKATGKEKDIVIKSSNGISKEEIERIKADAEKHKDEDAKRKATLDALNMAEALAYQTKKTFNDDNVKEKVDEADLKSINDKADEVLKAVEAKDDKQATALAEELKGIASKVGAKLYGQTGAQPGQSAEDITSQFGEMFGNMTGQGAPGAQQQPSAAPTNEGANVQDVDFEEVK